MKRRKLSFKKGSPRFWLFSSKDEKNVCHGFVASLLFSLGVGSGVSLKGDWLMDGGVNQPDAQSLVMRSTPCLSFINVCREQNMNLSASPFRAARKEKERQKKGSEGRKAAC